MSYNKFDKITFVKSAAMGPTAGADDHCNEYICEACGPFISGVEICPDCCSSEHVMYADGTQICNNNDVCDCPDCGNSVKING